MIVTSVGNQWEFETGPGWPERIEIYESVISGLHAEFVPETLDEYWLELEQPGGILTGHRSKGEKIGDMIWLTVIFFTYGRMGKPYLCRETGGKVERLRIPTASEAGNVTINALESPEVRG